MFKVQISGLDLFHAIALGFYLIGFSARIAKIESAAFSKTD